ncbi:carbohydrate kinase family protein [Candidatus Sumerlaeota bacterium]
MSNEDIEIVAAGHLCLDIIPAFNIQDKIDNISSIFIPGTMINMGKCVVVGGGPVTNAGVSIKRLGPKVELIGKCGDDDFGNLILAWYEKYEGHFAGLHQVPGESTSYTIAICVPGIDRFYLHHCGANDTFGRDDVDFDIVARAKACLLGYPPWMKKLYRDNGSELTAILDRTKELDTTTALDLSIPDIESEAGQCDWQSILTDWIPRCDIMVPSAEEIYFFLHKDEYLERKRAIGPNVDILDHMSVNEVSRLADQMIEMGTGVAMVKCGHRGLYVRTAGAERLAKFGAAKPANLENWANRELWFPVYQEEKFVGALGSGDAAIAGFMSAFVWGHSVESSLRYANAAGSMNVTVPDGLSWNKGFDDLTRRIEAGWPTKEMHVEEEGWSQKGGFWVGPADSGAWETQETEAKA